MTEHIATEEAERIAEQTFMGRLDTRIAAAALRALAAERDALIPRLIHALDVIEAYEQGVIVAGGGEPLVLTDGRTYLAALGEEEK